MSALKATGTRAFREAFAAALAVILLGTVPNPSHRASDPFRLPLAPASTIIEDFESGDAASRWKFSNGPEFPGAKGSFRILAGKGRKGSKGGVLSFDFRGGGNYVAAVRSFSPALGHKGVRFQVAGWVPGTRIVARLTDETGQTFQKGLPISNETVQGWLTYTVMAGEYEVYWGGAEDGVFHGGIAALALLVDKDLNYYKTGSIAFDDVEGVVSARTVTDPFGTDALPAFSKGKLEDRLGVNIHDWGGWAFLDKAREAGFGFVRMDMIWCFREPTRGVYDFDWHDALLRELAARGMRAYLILDYGNLLYYDGPGAYDDHWGLATPAYRSAFARFAAAAARRFNGKNVTFEVWNEPNIPNFWRPQPNAKNYNLLARAALNAVRGAAPDIPVVVGATSGVDVAFIDKVLSNGGLNNVDAVSIHPYRGAAPETFYRESAIVERVVAERTKRGDIPLYNAEWGYTSTSFGGRTPAAYKRQALYCIRLILANLLRRVPRTVWYDLVDDGDDPKNVEHNFGLLKRRSLAPKPAYEAVKAFRDLWPSGAPALGTFDTRRADVYGLLVSGGPLKLAAVWTDRPDTVLSIEVPERTGQKFFDMYGKPMTPPRSGRNRILKLREQDGPIYIKLN